MIKTGQLLSEPIQSRESCKTLALTSEFSKFIRENAFYNLPRIWRWFNTDDFNHTNKIRQSDSYSSLTKQNFRLWLDFSTATIL